jgi:hypothetical protein
MGTSAVCALRTYTVLSDRKPGRAGRMGWVGLHLVAEGVHPRCIPT